jgi:hypothetical protein
LSFLRLQRCFSVSAAISFLKFNSERNADELQPSLLFG